MCACSMTVPIDFVVHSLEGHNVRQRVLAKLSVVPRFGGSAALSLWHFVGFVVTDSVIVAARV